MDQIAERKIADREEQAAKAAYAALVQKKECPSCRRQQSYDQVRKRQTRCNECKLPFKYPVVWDEVKRSFMRRNDPTSDKAKEEKELESELSELEAKRGERKAVRFAFLERMDGAAARKKERSEMAAARRKSETRPAQQPPRRGSASSIAGGGNDRLNYSLHRTGKASAVPAAPALGQLGRPLAEPAASVDAQMWHARRIIGSRLFGTRHAMDS
jgi:hypothetical protein